MASLAELERHRRERGLILELLASSGSGSLSFTSLWRLMDARAFTVSKDSLRFHIEQYLEPRGFVQATRARDLPGWEDSPAVIPGALVTLRLLPDGLMILNRSKHDLEVVIE